MRYYFIYYFIVRQTVTEIKKYIYIVEIKIFFCFFLYSFLNIIVIPCSFSVHLNCSILCLTRDLQFQ